MQLHVLILGAAAGGGLPQWNCGCENCNRARRGEIPSLTQSSIAVSADGEHWVALNASPDIRTQLAASPPLHPTGPRVSPIVGVLVTNGDIDHVAGLLTLRESQTFTLYGTAEILDVIGANPIFDALAPSSVTRQPIALETSFDLELMVDRLRDERDVPSAPAAFDDFRRKFARGVAFVTYDYAVDGMTMEIAKYAEAMRNVLPISRILIVG